MKTMKEWEEDGQEITYPMCIVSLDGTEYEPANPSAAAEFVKHHARENDRIEIRRVWIKESKWIYYQNPNIPSDHLSDDSSA